MSRSKVQEKCQCVSWHLYTLCERENFSLKGDLSQQKKNNNSNKPDAEKEGKDFVQSTVQTFEDTSCLLK